MAPDGTNPGTQERRRLNTRRSYSIILPESARFNSTFVLSVESGLRVKWSSIDLLAGDPTMSPACRKEVIPSGTSDGKPATGGTEI